MGELSSTCTAVAERLALRPGLVLANRYEIRRPLGRGGMGEVWLAYDLRLRVDVALKALLPRGARPESLHGEIRAAREVVSPNVCRVFDLVEADGRELLSMEFVDGISLRQLLDERSPLDFFQAQEIAAQFLAGLEAIHAAGLVHRDFKPENVMITRTGRVVVMDFGLARALDV
jgi:eukaryotic-like serine/threonine-protein kinase